MNLLQRRRMILVVSLVGGLGLALGLILYALKQNINLFYSPTQLAQASISHDRTIRVGGMVVKDSVKRAGDLSVEFTITDFNQQLNVNYRGILPDLFREGQGIVALGKLDEKGKFHATEVLAKHDEKYMPPEVAGSLHAAQPVSGKTPYGS